MPAIPTTTLDAIAELYESGLGYRAIGTKLDLSRDTVRGAVKRMVENQGLLRKPDDLPTEVLDRMELICYRISKRRSVLS
jgi:DNA-binding NarL/FixJ family response regulator